MKNEQTLTRIETNFGAVYMDTLMSAQDNKLRIYDSRKEYLGYVETESLYDTAYESRTPVERLYDTYVQEVQSCKTVEDLVEMLIPDEHELITTSPINVAKHLFGIPLKDERKAMHDIMHNEWVNIIGDHFIVIKEA